MCRLYLIHRLTLLYLLNRNAIGSIELEVIASEDVQDSKNQVSVFGILMQSAILILSGSSEWVIFRVLLTLGSRYNFSIASASHFL